jgi:hypothetical protein
MAVLASKTWVAGEVLTASDLNGEFLNILTNGEDLGWPATKLKNLNGNILQLDASGATTISADEAGGERIDIKVAGTDLFRFDGATATTPVNGYSFIAQDAGTYPTITLFGTDTDIGLNVVPKGAGTLQQNGTRVLLLGDEQTENSVLSNQVFW